MVELAGKTAVVTGAASGIGFALSRRFADEGMQVVLADVEPGALDVAVTALRTGGASAVGVPTDVRDPAEVDRLAAAAREAFGAVHVLVNNAGVAARGRAWDIDLVDWHWVFDVCFWGIAHGVQSFVPEMMRHGDEGYIVNTASMLGMGSAPERAAYETAKQAVTGLTEGLYFDLKEAAPQLHVSLLCPGYTRTNIRTSRRNHPVSPEPDVVPVVGRDGTDPSAVADLVLDAMRESRFYVFADPEVWLPVMRRRFDAILNVGDPQPLSLD